MFVTKIFNRKTQINDEVVAGFDPTAMECVVSDITTLYQTFIADKDFKNLPTKIVKMISSNQKDILYPKFDNHKLDNLQSLLYKVVSCRDNNHYEQYILHQGLFLGALFLKNNFSLREIFSDNLTEEGFVSLFYSRAQYGDRNLSYLSDILNEILWCIARLMNN